MTPMPDATVVLASSYDALTELVSGLDDPDFRRPTGCQDWSVAALTFHLLLDAQRCLIATADPSDARPDTSAADYWRRYADTGGNDEESRTSHRRYVARSAAAYPSHSQLVRHWTHSARAAVAAVRRADPTTRVATQGCVLTVTDFADTLVVEATLHHLDLIAHLGTAPEPPADALVLTRRTLEELLGSPTPPDWSDADAARVLTGRATLSAARRDELGESAHRLPLIR